MAKKHEGAIALHACAIANKERSRNYKHIEKQQDLGEDKVFGSVIAGV